MGFIAELDADLLAPAIAGGIEDLAELWGHDDAVVRCRRPPDMEEIPDLPIRVRGALGRVLRRYLYDFPETRDAFGRPRAYRALWQHGLPAKGSTPIARPYVVQADMAGGRIEARVRLFGWARWWGPEVLRALAEAMAGGIRLKTPRGIFVPLEVEAAAIERTEGLTLPGPGITAGKLKFLTPVQVRRGDRLVIDPAAIMLAAVRRAEAVAPWMGMRLRADMEKLAERCHSLRYGMDVHSAEWVRYSLAGGPVPKEVHAMGGAIRFGGRIDPIAPYLAIAEAAGIGSSTTLGFGRVQCVLI